MSNPLSRLMARWLVGWADAANRSGRWERAAVLYGAALRMRPKLWAVRVQHGHALKETGRLHRAAAAYRTAAADAGGGDAEPWLQLAHALKLLGRRDDARATFGTVLALDPANQDARREHEHLAAAEAAAGGMMQALLDVHELPPAVGTLLDTAFYRSRFPALAHADLPALIVHVAQHGIPTLAPLRPDAVFDPDFYSAFYLRGRLLRPLSAYRHWLSLGVPPGALPNRAAWVDDIGARSECLRLDPVARAALHAILANERAVPPATPPFADLVDTAAVPAPSPEVGAFLVRHLRQTGFGSRAARLAARLGLPAEGELPPSQDVPAPPRTAAETIERATALAAARDSMQGLALLAHGRRRWPEAAALRHVFHRLATRAIELAWEDGEVVAATGDIARAQAMLTGRLRAVIALCPDPAPLPGRPIRRLAIVGNADLPQCRFYRIEQKCEQLAEAGIAATFFDERFAVPEFLARLSAFEAVIFYRVPAHFHIVDAMLSARALGLLTIYEIDDLLFDAAHHPLPLGTYGGSLTPAAHRGLALAVPMYAVAMSLCEVGVASTAALADHMRPLVRRGRVEVHPNGLGRAHLRAGALAPIPPPDKRLRIVYGSYTLANKADVEALLLPALRRLADRLGAALSVILVGSVERTAGMAALGPAVTILPPLALPDYWALLATADIVVAPLAPSVSADAKSAIKWLEAAVLGVPAVVSRTATMRDTVEHGVTGFLCDTPADWTEVLDRLARDPDVRQRVAAAAKAAALQRYGPSVMAASLGRLIRDVGPPVPATPVKPRVAVVNVFYPPQHFGGATRVVHDNVRRLARMEALDVAVFATEEVDGPPGRLRSYPFDGVPVTVVSCPGGDDPMRADDPLMADVFGQWLDAEPPALVHFHCVQRLTAAVVAATRDRGIPYVITVHDAWWVSPYQFLLDKASMPVTYDFRHPGRALGAGQTERLLRLSPLLRGAAAVLAVSEPFAALHRACGVARVRVIPNGISPLQPLPRAPHRDNRIRLGYLGGLYPHKGWHVIEDALRHGAGQGFSLLVIDHGMTEGEKREETWNGLPVSFRGKVPAATMVEVYAEIDVLLAPSLWPESFGLVTREALCCGCWVVAADRGAIGMDIREGINGFRIDVSSPVALRATLDAMRADPARFRATPPRTELRTDQDQADDLAALYRTLLPDRWPVEAP